MANGGKAIDGAEGVEDIGIGGVGAIDRLGQENPGSLFVIGGIVEGNTVLPFPLSPGGEGRGESGELPVFVVGVDEWCDACLSEIDVFEKCRVLGDDGIVVGPIE